MQEGWIKVHKRIQENHLWKERREFSKFEAWMWILLNAHGGREPQKIFVDGEFIILKRGELCFSIRYMMEAWRWKSTKRVLNFVRSLEKSGSIVQKKETRRKHITICNYALYNPMGNTKETRGKHEGNSRETVGKREGNKENEVNHC